MIAFGVTLFFLSFSKITKNTRIIVCLVISCAFFIFIYKRRTKLFLKQQTKEAKVKLWQNFKEHLQRSPRILQLTLLEKICKKLNLKCKIYHNFIFLPEKQSAITFLPDAFETSFFQKMYQICLRNHNHITWFCICLNEPIPQTPYYLKNKLQFISYLQFCNLMQVAKLTPSNAQQPATKFYNMIFLPEKANRYLLLCSLFLSFAYFSSFSWIYIFCGILTFGLWATIKILQMKKKKESPSFPI